MKKLTFVGAALLLSFSFSNSAYSSVIVLSDDFDPGIDAGTFSATSNASAAGNGTSGFLSGNALHFDGSGVRFATTTAVNVSSGGSIAFNFRGGNESVDGDVFWEDSEGSGEWVDLSYSIDGGTLFTNFLDLSTEMDQGENPTVWNAYDITIPLAAQTSNTLFRFQQRDHSGSNFDHWAIDDLSIASLSSIPEPGNSLGIVVMLSAAVGFRQRRLVTRSL